MVHVASLPVEPSEPCPLQPRVITSYVDTTDNAV